jgi:alkylhydroperoxidase family enzyme
VTSGADDADRGLPIREDLRDLLRRLPEHVASPGTWWTGAERVAAVGEARRAAECALCRAREQALSPNAVRGVHDSLGVLPERAVDVAHRVRTDSGRLSQSWYGDLLATGLSDAAYVELVAVVTMTAGLDYFARALGSPPVPLPEPRAGQPSRRRPAGAKPHGAWVPTIAIADADGPEADLYPPGMPAVPNIASALSLVPSEARVLRRVSEVLYMGIEHVPDPIFRRGPLERPQMELVAARVSALNQCFY